MESKQTRLANLRQLIKREGAVSQLALRLQISPIYIYRVLDGKFNIGDSMARKIEDSYGFPSGWMDVHHEGGEGESRAVPTLEAAVRPPAGIDAAPPPARIPLPLERAPTEAPWATATPVTPSVVAPGPVPAAVPPAPVSGSPTRAEEEGKDRLIVSIINALDRMLVANGLELSDLERARLLMKAAETILDGGAGTRSTGTAPKPVLKVTGPG